jgi:hypothetical protein
MCLVPGCDGVLYADLQLREALGQLLHGSARTTAGLRRAIQQSQESLATLAAHSQLNPKTVVKWKQRTPVHDAPMGLKPLRSTILTLAQAARIVAFRQHTRLPLDDCLYALQATIPHVTPSARHRCLTRPGINHLPEMTGAKPQKQKFKAYPIRDFHIDIAEVRTEEGKLPLFVAIDRTSKFASSEWHEQAKAHV